MVINRILSRRNKSIYFIFIMLIILSACNNTKESKFTIKNESNVTLVDVNIYVSNQHFSIQKILPQSSVSKTFISRDSRYKVIAKIAGKMLEKEGHYVASGIVYNDIIFINNKQIRIVSSFKIK